MHEPLVTLCSDTLQLRLLWGLGGDWRKDVVRVGDERRRNDRDDERACLQVGVYGRQLLARELAAQLDALTWWLIRV